MSSSTTTIERPQAAVLRARIAEPRRFLQVVTGARQVGKTTMVRHVLAGLPTSHVFASADGPIPESAAWIATHWERARIAAEGSEDGAVLALDEIQKIDRWSEIVKRLWDEDTHSGTALKVIILGSAPLLIQDGLTESLAGRFERIHLPHWTYAEMRDAFGYTLDDFVRFGSYPGAAELISEPERWRRYVLDSLIETTIARDVLMLTRVDKPALLRRLFELGCRYSGQVLSYTKMLGQLQDAGNTTTLAHYLDLLSAAGMLVGLEKYAGDTARQRASSPKLQVLNPALMTAQLGPLPDDDPALRGRLVESAVGAHLANAAAEGRCELFYWRANNREVDFVVRRGRDVVAIEVKSSQAPHALPGLDAFAAAFQPRRVLLVGGEGIPIEEFLVEPVERWLG